MQGVWECKGWEIIVIVMWRAGVRAVQGTGWYVGSWMRVRM